MAEVAENATKPTRKHPYQTPEYFIEDGETYLVTPEGDMPIEVFGKHNLNNLAGAKWVCQHMGVDEEGFYEAISTFKGASKRLEKIAETKSTTVYKDFAHSPSKVVATTQAVKEQFPKRKLIACLELHTYSSLNAEFLKHYKNTLDEADEAVVFYSPEAVAIKKLEEVDAKDIEAAFQHPNLKIYTNPQSFQEYLKNQDYKNTTLLLMSSGNYGGLDFDTIDGFLD